MPWHFKPDMQLMCQLQEYHRFSIKLGFGHNWILTQVTSDKTEISYDPFTPLAEG